MPPYVCGKEGAKSLFFWSPPTNCSCYLKAATDLNLSGPPWHKVLAAVMQWFPSFSVIAVPHFNQPCQEKKDSQVCSAFGMNGLFKLVRETTVTF